MLDEIPADVFLTWAAYFTIEPLASNGMEALFGAKPQAPKVGAAPWQVQKRMMMAHSELVKKGK